MGQLIESLRQRAKMLCEQTAADVFEQALHDGERLQLGGGEPETGELKCTGAACWRVAISACCGVEDDRSAQGVFEHVDGAMKRGFGALEFRHEILERNCRSAIREDGVKVKDAVEFVHDFSVGRAVRAPALARHRE